MYFLLTYLLILSYIKNELAEILELAGVIVKLFDDDVKLYNADCQQLKGSMQEAGKSVFLTFVPVIVF